MDTEEGHRGGKEEEEGVGAAADGRAGPLYRRGPAAV
jgi:hypothetical protein